MNHSRAISLNQNALRRVVEEIFALLELVLDGTITRLPHVLHVAANRLLVPAESALRRLIVVAAHGLVIQTPKPRPMPQGKHIPAKGLRPLSFQLYDTRKRFDRKASPHPKAIEPRVHFFNFAPLVASLLPQVKKQNTAIRICRRFAAFKLALENIPHQAKRLAAWQAKRALKETSKFRFPLRPGAPPGSHRNQALEIDLILKECHHLASTCHREAPS